MNRLDRINIYAKKLENERLAKEIYKNEKYNELMNFIGTNMNRIKEMAETNSLCSKNRICGISVGYNTPSKGYFFIYEDAQYGSYIAYQSEAHGRYIVINSIGGVRVNLPSESYSTMFSNGSDVSLEHFDPKLTNGLVNNFDDFEKSFYSSVDKCLDKLGV